MKRKKAVVLILVLLLSGLFTSCAAANANIANLENVAVPDDGDAAMGDKILVIYYSPNGQVKGMAETIRDYSGGRIGWIKTEDVYPDNTDDFEETVRREISERKMPEIQMDIADLNAYDMIIVGFPVWYGQVPMAIPAFLSSYDFTGKKVAPFVVGDDADTSVIAESLRESCPDADWEECVAISGEEQIAPWLRQIGVFSELVQIKAGNEILYGGLYQNREAEDFANLLPMTVNLYIPAGFARAFNLDAGLSDGGYRTRTYEIGKMAYWPEGPAIAVFVDDSEPQTVVPVIHLGKIFTGASGLAEYTEITIEKWEDIR